MKMFFLALLMSSFMSASYALPAKSVLNTVQQLVRTKDYLGLRIYIRKAYAMKLGHAEWFEIKNILATHGDQVGYDLAAFWNARNSAAKNQIDLDFEKVDQFLAQQKFSDAFKYAQNIAQRLRFLAKSRSDAKWQIPFAFHQMGRALYGAGRFEEALKVYNWIGISYPYFSQVLFERMWAGFKAGRVDLALGAIASQRSTYFSQYITPEAYLVQTYLYKRLCREDDQQQVVAEMKAYEALLEDAKSELPLVRDTTTLVLSRLSREKTKDEFNLKLITQAERTQEQTELKAKLKGVAEAERAKTLKDIKIVIAYQQLTNVTDTKQVLQPVKRMESRDQLLKQNLEVWPADSKEEWIDEVGKHVLIGESLCKTSH